MDKKKEYETGITGTEGLICMKCNVQLQMLPATLSYMNSSFPADLPACPKCGMLYIPEQLATGKILHVEKSLEDK